MAGTMMIILENAKWITLVSTPMRLSKTGAPMAQRTLI
jgi:hypothetical protein